MPADSTHKPSEREWEKNRRLITKWYCDDKRPLEAVRAEMKTLYNFDASNQYQSHFNMWGVRKNLTPDGWRALAVELRRRGLEPKHARITFHGRELATLAVKKNIRRYRDNTNAPYKGPLPLGIRIANIQTPVKITTTDETPPALIFESQIRQILDIILANYTSTDPHTLQCVTNLACYVSTTLPAIQWPQANHMTILSPTLSPINKAIGVLYYRLLRTLANGHIEEAVSDLPRDFPDALLAPFGKYLLSAMSPTTGSFVTRAIIPNLFRYAVVMNSGALVHHILKFSSSDIPVQHKVFLVRQRKGTALEYALWHGMGKVVKVILSFLSGVPQLAMNTKMPDSLIEDFLQNENPSRSKVGRHKLDQLRNDPGLRNLLLYFSVRIPAEFFACYIEEGLDDHTVEAIVERFVQKEQDQWIKAGVFVFIFKTCEIDTCLKILDLMNENGISLNHRRMPIDGIPLNHRMPIDGIPLNYRRVIFEKHGLETIMDAAIHSGRLCLAKKLLSSGAVLRMASLHHAIINGNFELVEWVTSSSNLVDHHSTWKNEPSILGLAIDYCDSDVWNMFALIPACTSAETLHDMEVIINVAHTEKQLTWLEDFILKFRATDRDSLLRVQLRKAIVLHKKGDVTSLLRKGAGVNVKLIESKSHYLYHRRRCLLQLAIESDALDMVEILIEADAYTSPTKTGYEHSRWYAFRAGLKKGDHQLLRCLSLGFQCDEANLNALLYRAHERGEPQQSTNILELTWSIWRDVCDHVDRVDRLCFMPLTAAVDLQSRELVNYILDTGVSLRDANVALSHAARQGSDISTLLVSRLVSTQGQLRDKNVGSSLPEPHILADLIAANQFENFEIAFRYLKKNGQCDFYAVESWLAMKVAFRTAIKTSASTGLQFCELILRYTACNPQTILSREPYQDFPNSDLLEEHKTAFAIAVETGHLPIVQLLLEHDADVNIAARNRIKRTPLQCAAQAGNLNIMRLLMKHNADVNAPPALVGGGTALQLAAYKGHVAAVNLLLEYGADVNAAKSASNGCTALEGAAEKGRSEIVEILMQKGAGKDLDQVSSAASLARENGFFAIADYLDACFTTQLYGNIAAAPVEEMELLGDDAALIEQYGDPLGLGFA